MSTLNKLIRDIGVLVVIYLTYEIFLSLDFIDWYEVFRNACKNLLLSSVLLFIYTIRIDTRNKYLKKISWSKHSYLLREVL